MLFKLAILQAKNSVHLEKMWNPYYEIIICNCTTKATIVYSHIFGTISIVWKYTIIMDNYSISNKGPYIFQYYV
jgi:hypothetical protein